MYKDLLLSIQQEVSVITGLGYWTGLPVVQFSNYGSLGLGTRLVKKCLGELVNRYDRGEPQ